MPALIALTLVLTLAVIAPNRAAADAPNNVQSLLSQCEDKDYGETFCIGFVSGIAAVMTGNCTMIRRGEGGSSILAADLEGTSYGAMVQTFTNWARANPKNWGMMPAAGVIIALSENFPCQ